ncbi:uncharacterized protein RBU57_010571 isoform 1-T2 [Macrochelys suwanniensis]
MPRSDPHSDCPRCLGESHIRDSCKICRSFKPRTKKERDIRLWALLMESALAPTRCAEQNRHRVPCLRCAAISRHLLVASTAPHRKNKGRLRHFIGIERRKRERLDPRWAALILPRAPELRLMSSGAARSRRHRPLRTPSTPEAFQAARDIMTLQVPGVPLGPRSRGKPPLGSRQSTPTRRRSRSRDRSRDRSPLSVQSRHSPQPPLSLPVSLSGKVPSDQSSRHRSTRSRELRHSRHRCCRCSRSSRSYRSRSSSLSSRHRAHNSRRGSLAPHHRRPRRRSVSRSSSSRRYRSSTSESQSRDKRRRRHRRSYHSHGTDRSTFTPTVGYTRATTFQPDQLVPPVPQQGQCQGAPWQGQWCQWTPWPPG